MHIMSEGRGFRVGLSEQKEMGYKELNYYGSLFSSVPEEVL